MMNRVDLIGRITRDLELRRAATGNAMLRFTIAVDRRIKQPGKQSADFIGCVAFGKTAENMARFLHKGSLISVEGRIQTGSYVNQQGQKVYTTDVIADSVQFLEPRNAGANAGGYVQDQSYGYDSGSQYGGGFQGGYPDESSYGYSGSGASPFAKSVDNGFSSPAAGSAAGGFTDSHSSSDDIIDDGSTLNLSEDDLPF